MNTDFRSILSSHARRYPLTRPTDLLKLIHQNVFGSGHLAPSPEIVCKRLADEFASCDKTEPFVETLGECSRVYIGSAVPASAADAAAACGASDSSDCRGIINKIAGFENRPADARLLEVIARLFILTADRFPADCTHADETSRAMLDDCINTAREVVRDGCFGFGINEFDSAVAEFAAAGYPAQSHSDIYRNAYRPAYRVVDSYFARLISCLYAISRLLDEKSGQVRVVIDGRAASGKTTAAELIAGYFSTTYTCAYPSTHPDAYPRVCPDTHNVSTDIIHADDFFLPPSLRTPERLNEVGGNLHRERFYDEIIANLDSPDGFSYRVFDCSKMDYAPEPRKVKPCRLLIFEGAYSLHPDFGDYYDLAIFSDISPDEQRLRILSRNGERMLKRFEQEWIPMEEKYFDGFNIRQKCKITI